MQLKGDMCYFFKHDNEDDLIDKIIISENDTNFKVKLTKALKFSKNFSMFSYF